MAKKTQKELLEEKFNLYINQREEIESLINKYFEIYQKLNGAIEAIGDLLSELQKKEATTATDSLE